MIGTQAEAETLVEYLLGSGYPWITHNNLPTGWTFLDAGAYRTAVLSPSNVVYKLDHNVDCPDSEMGNAAEWEAYQACYDRLDTNPTWRIAEMSFYEYKGHAIIAAEYIEGEHEEMCFWCEMYGCCDEHEPDSAISNQSGRLSTEMDKIMKITGISDLHTNNWILTNAGHRVIIDVGCPVDLDNPADF